jgi:hypothetical protein
MRAEPQICAGEGLVLLEQSRHSRFNGNPFVSAANYAAKDCAPGVLAAELARSPRNILQKLVESALELCQADTASIGFFEKQNGVEVFWWGAMAGFFASARNRTMPRDASPCGVCIDRNATQLMYWADCCFPTLHNPANVTVQRESPFGVRGAA